uniref:ATP-binding protein n=1 Tax=Pseudomonas sp. G.S.17 TaxID=3137451 RepID=UPI00405453A4
MGMMLRSTLTQVLLIEDSSQVGHARRTVQQLAEALDFCEADAGRAALVTTELASNLLKHATRGELHLRTFRSPSLQGIEVIAVDRGPGFDVHDCLTDGFSTRGTQGIGLGAISRQADVFDVHSDARGSVVLARFFPRGQSISDVRFGVSQHSLGGDPACGDVWSVAIKEGWISVLMIDGLGHGEDAELAARAGENAFARQPFASPVFTLEEMHDAMRGTRGGAVAVAQFDGVGDSLRFVGIGNIGGTLIGAERPRGLASHPGIVGLQFRKAQTFDFPQIGGQLLIMYSDGLQSRWDLREYAGLAFRHPAVIAAVLHRDFCRGRDDVTVLVIALETANA